MDAPVNPAEAALESLIDSLHAKGRLRVWSLVITVFGDAVVPRGGRVGLSTLQDIMGRLRIEPGAVRTALSRLARDGWVTREREGRNAYYRLADQGRHAFDLATRRIYAAGPPPWDGEWTVVLLPKDAANGKAAETARLLAMAGFAPFGPAAWLRPEIASAADLPPLATDMVVLRGRSATEVSAERIWSLGEIGEAYRNLAADLCPLAAAVAGGARLDPLAALAGRTVVNHVWRRIVLRDPGLPAALLPADWPAEQARETVRAIYAALTPPSEAWLDAAGLPGQLSPQSFAGRFGSS